MAYNRLNGRVVYLICCLVFLQTTLEKMLDIECVKRRSASYKQPTTQLTGPQRTADRDAALLAVDGDETTCSKTIYTSGSANDLPWWQVDLGEKTNITFIQITNSGRHPTALRVYIRYDVESIGKACGIYHVLSGNETRIIWCKPAYGREVKIVGKHANDYLSLCEVQVFNDSVQLTQGVNYEVWFNKTDVSYRFLNNVPDSSGVLPTFDAPRDVADTYGMRMRTYFNAPESGWYIFNMTGNNKCSLYFRDVNKQEWSVPIGSITRDSTNGADSKPHYLIKDDVYELTAVMVKRNKKDHLRIGVTFPNGTFVGPMNSRIFINETAAHSLTKNLCYESAITVPPSHPPTKPTDVNNENAIQTAVSHLVQDRKGFETKFQVLDKLEKLGFEKANGLNLGNRSFASYVVQVGHFVFAAVALNMHTRLGFNFPGNLENFTEFPDYSSISFPREAFPSTIGRTSAVFMMFKPLKEMLEQTGSERNQLADNVISATMEQGVVNEKSMSKPFTLVFRNTKVSIKGQRHCVFWLEGTQCTKDARFGRWSDKGCSLVHQNETHTTCQCNHLTKFSILFPVPEGSEEDELKLELITYVGLALSSVGCFITFVVYLILRITKTLKSIVHLNLVFALGLADLLFLFGNLAEKNKDLCFASTVLTFYLYLAVFAWMLIEGVHLYFLVIRVFGSEDRKRRRYYHVFGWGVPMVIVAITAGILRYDLMSEKHCWLSAKTASIWVFIGPALFVVLVNTFILAAVLRTTMTLLRNDPGHRKEKSAMRTLAMLVPILGTTWVFGVVAFTNESIVFQYLFAVCNAFQGFFIFILYCLFNTEVRHEYQRRRKAWRTERELDSKRSRQNNSFDVRVFRDSNE